MDTYLVILFSSLGGLISFILGWWIAKRSVKPIEDNNKKIEHKKQQLEFDLAETKSQIEFDKQKLAMYEDQLNRAEKQYQSKIEALKKAIATSQSIANNAYQERSEKLEKEYQQKVTKYAEQSDHILADIRNQEQKLESLKQTRAAAIEAARKEQVVSDNKDEYRLILAENELSDVIILQDAAKKISKPRSIYMAIWTAYYQLAAKNKFPKILGSNDAVCGIYKITNQETGECYIGQARDMKKRFYEHCRCGLGVDTPVGNKLYAAMREYGLDNFTFELLLECKPEELNKKEKYFIELYQANIYGYNGNKGVSNANG